MQKQVKAAKRMFVFHDNNNKAVKVAMMLGVLFVFLTFVGVMFDFVVIDTPAKQWLWEGIQHAVTALVAWVHGKETANVDA